MIYLKNLLSSVAHDPLHHDRLYRWIELILVIMLAVVSARLVAVWISPAVVPGTGVLAQNSISAGVGTKEAARDGPDRISSSPALMQLFGLASGSAAVPNDGPLQPTSLNLVLKGIIADQGSDNRFALIAVRGQKEKVYRVGEKIEGAEIIRIESRRVVIRRNGITEALNLEINKLSGIRQQQDGAVTPANSVSNTGIRSISDNQRVIPRSTMKQQLANLPSLLQQAAAVPHVDDGEQIGFRIVSIQKGSIFEQLGFRPEDIIYAVNGKPVRNVGDA